MIKAIVFDADGVFIISELFSRQYAKDFGVDSEALLPFFTGKFQECLVGKADLKNVVAEYLKDWQWNKSIDELLKYWFESENNVDKRLVGYVLNLKHMGIKCCLGTNQEKYRTQFITNEMGFNKIFDYIFSSAEIGYKKPQQEFFQYILDKLHVNRDEILFWDNSLGHIVAARVFGLKAELYVSFSDFENKMNSYLSV